MLNDRVERTVLMIRRTAQGNPSTPLIVYSRTKCIDQGGFADTGLTVEQYNLSEPFLGLLPSPSQKSNLFVTTHKENGTLGGGFFFTSVFFDGSDHAEDGHRIGHALETMGTYLLQSERTLDQVSSRGTDYDRIRDS